MYLDRSSKQPELVSVQQALRKHAKQRLPTPYKLPPPPHPSRASCSRRKKHEPNPERPLVAPVLQRLLRRRRRRRPLRHLGAKHARLLRQRRCDVNGHRLPWISGRSTPAAAPRRLVPAEWELFVADVEVWIVPRSRGFRGGGGGRAGVRARRRQRQQRQQRRPARRPTRETSAGEGAEEGAQAESVESFVTGKRKLRGGGGGKRTRYVSVAWLSRACFEKSRAPLTKSHTGEDDFFFFLSEE